MNNSGPNAHVKSMGVYHSGTIEDIDRWGYTGGVCDMRLVPMVMIYGGMGDNVRGQPLFVSPRVAGYRMGKSCPIN